MEEVRLIDIERFAIHDGPGIRTVVFFQGCTLNCPWCANPESKIRKKVILHDNKKCIKCGTCLKECPKENIILNGNRLIFKTDNCFDCTICRDVCTENAIKISGENISVDKVLETIYKDKEYYVNSNGGVTFSGGEAILQVEGLYKLLENCKNNDIHTAIETSGQVPHANLCKILPLTDLFLFDIKHLDSDRLKSEVNGNLSLILQNLETIVNENPDKVVIRVPCIPNFNLNENFMNKLFELALHYKIKRIDLLPYHTLGIDKYVKMGLEYSYDKKSILKDVLLPFIERGRKLGLNIRIDR